MNKRPSRNGEVSLKIQKTLLVDGNSLFKTSFHGAKDSYNKQGVHIGGIYQFFTTLRMVLNSDLYHRVYVFWDGSFSGKLRYDIYEPYKSGRGKDYKNGTKPIDESELLERKIIWEYLNEMYIRQLTHEVIEGDDFIAYYCLTKKQNEEITILTNDKDMLQLIDKDVKLYVLGLKKYIDNTNFSSYYPYHYENVSLIKIMVGDSSDSIKGIKGLGEDTLISLFPEFNERKVMLSDVIKKATILQENRLQNKQKPLKVLNNIINSITDGVQGNRIYEINEQLINLKKPMLTDDGINSLEQLIDGTLDSTNRDLKNVLTFMKRDGLDKAIGEQRYPEYLIPFKKLIEREKIIF